jgi:hypothetical protein
MPTIANEPDNSNLDGQLARRRLLEPERLLRTTGKAGGTLKLWNGIFIFSPGLFLNPAKDVGYRVWFRKMKRIHVLP